MTMYSKYMRAIKVVDRTLQGTPRERINIEKTMEYFMKNEIVAAYINEADTGEKKEKRYTVIRDYCIRNYIVAAREEKRL